MALAIGMKVKKMGKGVNAKDANGEKEILSFNNTIKTSNKVDNSIIKMNKKNQKRRRSTKSV
jgi:hypothetical protein